MRALSALSFVCVALLLAAAGVQAQDNTAYPVDDSHVLTAEGLGWKFVDLKSGKEKNLILPAFHPEQSHPVLSGQRMAYIALTKHGDRQQLGCVTYDLAKGKVVNRKDSSLFARDDVPLTAPSLTEDGAATCQLKGDRCEKGGACTVTEEDVALNFVPGAVAGKPLKSAKGAKGRKAGKGRHGAHKASIKGRVAGKKHAAHKAAAPHKSKTAARKAKPQ